MLRRSFHHHLRFGVFAIIVVILTPLILRIIAFSQIFFQHAGVALTQDEILSAHSIDHESRTAVIPRITHQIFHNWTHPDDQTLPEDWSATRQTCLDMNSDWEHWLWTERKSREFIAEEYPWFLSTYQNFQYPVQRIDTLRYFLMRHYGGIYIDLDNGCKTTLEPLRYFPAWTTDGGHGTLSNNILGSEPNHPFWIKMTDSIISHAWNYPLPFLTISYASGQWFLTSIWEQYHHHLSPGDPVLMRVMMDQRPGAAPWTIFTQTRGGTWNNWDNQMFTWIGEHIWAVAALVLAPVCCSVGCLVALSRRRKNPEALERSTGRASIDADTASAPLLDEERF